MTAPHDTPEAVEAMALGVERTFYSDAAGMLRRLHQRAVDAERERDELQGLLVTHEICADRIKATAREAAAWAAGAEAMRAECERACNSHGNTLARNGLPMSAISVARTCAVIVGTLPIPPAPTTTAGAP